MYESESVNQNRLLRVGIYLRLSDEDRDKENKMDDSESIKNQRYLLLEEISKRENFVYVDEYCDEDLSGAGTYRPQFERLISDCEKRKLDIVLCKSQSRFSRDMEVIERYLHNKFVEWGVRFISLSDNADTYNKGNKKSRQINGLVNEWFLEDTSNNIRSAFGAKMQHGEYISPFTSYGYDISPVDNNKLIVDTVAAETVKMIFNLYLTGLGNTSIAKHLNSLGIPCPSLYKLQKGSKLNVNSKKCIENMKWHDSAIRRILQNELYIGTLVQGKSTTVSYKNKKKIAKPKELWVKTPNAHEPIIDIETFNKVQIAIKERTKPLKATNTVHIFSGKVFCLECKQLMKKKNSSQHNYLVCTSNIKGYDDCINKKSMRYDTLEQLVLDEINKKIKEFYDKELLEKEAENSLKSLYKNKIKSLEMQKADFEKKMIKTRDYLRNLYEDKVNGLLTTDQFKELMGNYNSNEDSYKEKIKSIEEEINIYKMKEQVSNESKKIINKYKHIKELNKIIVDEFIDKIFIGKLDEDKDTREIQILWNFN